MFRRVGARVLVLFMLAASAFAQESVDINLNVRHTVGGEDTFQRDRYVLLHAGLRDNDWDSNAQRSSFLTDYDVYLGRNNGSLPWVLSQTDQDSLKPGWVDHADLQSNGNSAKVSYGNDTSVHPLEFRRNNMMVGGQMSMYPNGQMNGNGFAIADYDALADYFEHYLTYYHGTGGTSGEAKPAMVEVVNEPFVKASQYSTTKPNIAQMHNVVAGRIKASHPEVLVGGYTAAHPAYEASNFGHWNSNWKMFIDTAGTNMDFFSLHLYDYLNQDITQDYAMTQYRSGSNVEVLLDMIEHYSMLALGEVKPFAISEFGAFEPITGGEPWAPENDWPHIRSFSTMLMQLLERPDRMLQAMPFMILKAEWGRDQTTGNPYGPRLLRQQFEMPGETGNGWVYTEFIKFFKLWADVNGTRVDTKASNLDIQVDAYVDGAEAYVILNNLEHSPKLIDLNLFDAYGTTVTGITVKHLYASSGIPTLVTNSLPVTTSQAIINSEATMILHYTFTAPLVINEASTESKYYATTYLQSISAGTPINFNLTNVNTSTLYGEAVLRLGIGRNHGKSLAPTLLVNGTSVPVPTNWRGYDQLTRDSFFGVLEVPVPYSLLQNNNTISVEFSDSGGHIASVAMQVFEFSSNIRNPTIEIPVDTCQILGSDVILGFTNGPANSYFALWSKTNLLDATWTTNQTGLPIDPTGSGSVTNPIVAPQEYYRLIESAPPPTPVTATFDWEEFDGFWWSNGYSYVETDNGISLVTGGRATANHGGDGSGGANGHAFKSAYWQDATDGIFEIQIGGVNQLFTVQSIDINASTDSAPDGAARVRGMLGAVEQWSIDPAEDVGFQTYTAVTTGDMSLQINRIIWSAPYDSANPSTQLTWQNMIDNLQISVLVP